jgi:hypothetical protein
MNSRTCLIGFVVFPLWYVKIRRFYMIEFGGS